MPAAGRGSGRVIGFEDDMKAGLIGCGKQAPKHISGLKAAGVNDIVVADMDPARAQALAASYADGTVRAAAGVEALLSDPAIEALSICTPTPAHAPLIRQAVAAGKHYLCEKPLCETAAEAEELARITSAAGLVGMVGYIYRFAPAFEKAKDILGDADVTGVSPVLGRITNAFFRIGGRGSHMAWKHSKAAGGGAINEMLVHMLDLAHWFFGEAERFGLDDVRHYWKTREINGETVETDAEDWVLASMRSKAGVDMLFQADFITPAFTQYVEIQGENGSFLGSIQSDFPCFVYCSKSAGGYDAGKTIIDNPPTNMFEAQMGAFVLAVQGKSNIDLSRVAIQEGRINYVSGYEK